MAGSQVGLQSELSSVWVDYCWSAWPCFGLSENFSSGQWSQTRV